MGARRSRTAAATAAAIAAAGAVATACGGADPPPPAPALLGPAHGDVATGQAASVRFRWAPVRGATAYRLQVEPCAGRCARPTGPDRGTVLRGTRYVLDLPERFGAPLVEGTGQAYRWRVVALGAGGRTSATGFRRVVVGRRLDAAALARTPRSRWASVLAAAGIGTDEMPPSLLARLGAR